MDGINTTTGFYAENSSTVASRMTQNKDKSIVEVLSNPVIVVFVVLLLILMLIILVGNVLVCRTVYVTRRLHYSAFYFVTSLAIADFFVGFLVVPVTLAYFMKAKWTFGIVACDGWILSNFWFCYASVLNLCMVSWDRYVAVTSPLRYKVRMRGFKVKWMLGCIWTFSFVISILFSLAVKFSKYRMFCLTVGLDVPYAILIVTGILVLPCAFLVFVNTKISLAARSQMRKIKIQAISTNWLNTTDCSNTTGTKRREREKKRLTDFTYLRKEIKTFKLFLVVIGVFMSCWTPFFVTMIISSYSVTPQVTTIMNYVITLGYSNSACNVFIYGCLNRDFRQALLSSMKLKSYISHNTSSRVTNVNDNCRSNWYVTAYINQVEGTQDEGQKSINTTL